MNTRRRFVTSVAGVAGTMAVRSPAGGASDRIRLGMIGPGQQGQALIRMALECPNNEFVAFADVYTRRLEEATKLVPTAKTYLDYRYLLEDKSVDAVLIATPQHLHCEHFVAAMDAGKHVYQEKTMAFTVEHAKRMRAAHQRAGKRAVQIGHGGCSSGSLTDARNFVRGGYLGKITELHAHHYRNTPHGKPQWSRPVLPDMTEENIIWKSFLGEAPPRPFDPNRYINWRFFWDYAGGNFYENMCHQLASWYKVLDLRIPNAVTAVGGVYLWKDGREVPDTMCVAMEHPEELLFNWTSGFGNNHFGTGVDVLGTDGTITTQRGIRCLPQKANRPEGTELVGKTPTPPQAHMQNFLDCIRTGQEPNCPFDLGFRVSIACRMAVDSYRQRRTVRWDPGKEQIV
ncbi:MAG: Gfo/Idh/MocA family oxidoreductase [Acidobacteriota bacterium]